MGFGAGAQARTSAAGNGNYQRHIGIDLLMARDDERLGQASLAGCLAEQRAQASASWHEQAAGKSGSLADPVDFLDRDLGFGANRLPLHRHFGCIIRAGPLVQLAGKNSRGPTITGTSPWRRARPPSSGNWRSRQAFVPSDEAD